MFEVDAHSAAAYLRQSGYLDPREPSEACELAGGVSNIVLLITLPDRGERFVLKQARGRLRVKDDWRCPVERIWREVETLRACGALLQSGSSPPARLEIVIPQVLFEDRENFLYAMTAAPAGHRTWKELLLTGPAGEHREVARACGHMLASLHAGSWKSAEMSTRLADRTFFEQLRLDPYYRQIARVHPEHAEAVQRLLRSLDENRLSLVHGDYSPKNLLVWPGHLMLIDFEVGHFGDPAFDLGFFLTHLVLKSVWAAERQSDYLALVSDFWRSYLAELSTTAGPQEIAELERRAVANLAACLLARVDGKSPVDYLSPQNRSLVRETAKNWLHRLPQSLDDALARLSGAKY